MAFALVGGRPGWYDLVGLPAMLRRRKVCRTLSRLTIGVAIVLVAMWVASTQFSFLLFGDDWYVNSFSGTVKIEINSLIVRSQTQARAARQRTTFAILVDGPSYKAKMAPPTDGWIHRSILRTRGTWGFGRMPAFKRDPVLGTTLSMPFWFAVVACACVVTLLWLIQRRPRPGFCPQCAYNLFGNVSGICPECGTEVPRHASA